MVNVQRFQKPVPNWGCNPKGLLHDFGEQTDRTFRSPFETSWEWEHGRIML